MLGRKEVERLRKEYPKGTRIVLDYMDDPQAPPPGTKGTVRIVDDMGTIHVRWDNGSGLGLCADWDKYHKDMEEEEARKILKVVACFQKSGVNCPRCGLPMEGKLYRNAHSRRFDIMICELCGTEEAFEDAGWNEKKTLGEWAAVKAVKKGDQNEIHDNQCQQ